MGFHDFVLCVWILTLRSCQKMLLVSIYLEIGIHLSLYNLRLDFVIQCLSQHTPVWKGLFNQKITDEIPESGSRDRKFRLFLSVLIFQLIFVRYCWHVVFPPILQSKAIYIRKRSRMNFCNKSFIGLLVDWKCHKLQTCWTYLDFQTHICSRFLPTRF